MALTIDLTPQEEAQFAAYARHRGLDPATLARTLLTASLPPPEAVPGEATLSGKSIAELMAEIGFAAGGPADLSTNPDHLHDFGETR